MKKLMMSILLSLLVSHSALALKAQGLIHKIPKNDKILETFNTVECGTCLLPTTFDITVWNMYKGKKDNWHRDYEQLLSESDILLGQEFKLKGKMKDVLLQPENVEVSLATSFISFRKYKTGVTTISKFKSYDARALRSSVREPFLRTPKLSLGTRYVLENGQIITFINIHAINFVKKRKLKKQLNQVIDYINEQTGPVVFAGDFNTNSKSKIKMMRNLLTNVGMKEAVFTGSDKRMKWLGNKLDYIWYKGLDLIEARVRGDINGSDHKPLQATFQVPIE